MNIEKYINIIEKKITDPTSGLPEEVFLLISRISPMINVDLLIKNTENEVLLTWRHKGQVYPEGWHVPGGIIRYKEKILDRVHKVAKIELGCKITSENKPIVINEIMLNQKNRGHFISLLFSCTLLTEPPNKLKYVEGIPQIGQWKWHKKCPKDIILPHRVYETFFTTN